MFKSWRLGRVLGFPVEINLSFLLLLAFVLLAWGGLSGLFVVLLAFASVFVHELGHALVARQRGVHVSGIEMSFFGGAAKMVQLPRSAKDEIAIAAAGPAVSLILAGIGLGLGIAVQSPLIALIGWVNLVIAGFNLIPALPMDGGRILRAALSYRMDYVRATDVAVTIARVFTVVFAVVGLAYGIWMLVLLSPFLWMMSSHEQRVARLMADDFAGYGRPVEVLGRDAWVHRQARSAGWDSPFDPRGGGAPFGGGYRGGGGPVIRRFTIRQRDGRLVIETFE